MKTRIAICALVLAACTVRLGWAQTPPAAIHGSGTKNVVPIFTGSLTIGSSELFRFKDQFGEGSFGIGPFVEWTDPATATNSTRLAIHHTRTDFATTAIFGIADSDQNPTAGVRGFATAGSGGVFGVEGLTFSGEGFGVKGTHLTGGGPGAGILGDTTSPDGAGGFFANEAGGNILVGAVGTEFNWQPVFRVDGTGKVFANGGFQASGADFAESFSVLGERARYGPGDLLVIDSTGKRRLALAQAPYSTLVAGIYSTKPGVLASPYGLGDPNLAKEIPLAVVGIVPCKVTTENGPIKPGDLLVTSSTPGHAMKGSDSARMLGAVVGKALEPLQEGTGLIQVLVTLQ